MTMPEEVKTDELIHGLMDTSQAAVRYLEGSWQYQIFNNLDELTRLVSDKLSEEELAHYTRHMEQFVKNPLRRQIGRLRSIQRSLEEIRRYLHIRK